MSTAPAVGPWPGPRGTLRRTAPLALPPAALAAVLALAALAAEPLLAAVVLGTQVGFITAWFRSTPVPAARLGALLALAAAGAADALLLRAPGGGLEPLAGLLGGAFVLALVGQLLRRDGRARVAASLTATVTATVLAVSGALWLGAGALGATGPRREAAAVTAAALAVGVLPALLPLPWWLTVPPGALTGALAGGVAAGGPGGLLLGLVGGAVGTTGLAATSYAESRSRRAAVAATLPVLLGGPVAYLLGRVLGG